MPYSIKTCKKYIEKISLVPLDPEKEWNQELTWCLTDHLQLGHAYSRKKEYERAIEMYTEANKKGQREATIALAVCLQWGWGCEKNMPKALNYYNEFLKLNVMDSMKQMKPEGDFGKIVQIVDKSVKTRSNIYGKQEEEKILVNHHLQYGKLIEELKKRQYIKAFDYFNDFLESKLGIAVMDTLGKYDEALLGEAVECFESMTRTAYERNKINAWYYMSVCYAMGLGVIRSNSTAHSYYEKYKKGFLAYIKERFEWSKKWSEIIKSAEKGDTCCLLKKDYERKYKKVVETLEQNSPPEEQFEEFRYFAGISREESLMDTIRYKNPKLLPRAVTCFNWCVESKKNEITRMEACYYMGICLAKGYGRTKNIQDAKMWFGYHDAMREKIYLEKKYEFLQREKDWMERFQR